MALALTNFGKATVSAGYDSAAVTIVLTTGHGAKLPSTFPFWLSWWDATATLGFADPADDPAVEIVKVTARTADTLTVTRGQDGTSAVNHNTAGRTYKMVLSVTKALLDLVQEKATSPSQGFRNLVVRNHQDVDQADAKVRFTADEITMDDGERVTTWDMTVDLAAAAGAGGLDAGVEENSVGYEIWALRKKSDGTKNGVFHKAKDYFKDEDQGSGATAQPFRDAAARTKVAQGFQVDTAGLLEKFEWRISSVTGAPTGNWSCVIYSDSAGNPNTVLATSDKYDIARLLNSDYRIQFTFRTPASLLALTQYHAVIEGTNTINGTAYWSLLGSASDVYARGSAKQFDGTTWTAASAVADLIFAAYITRNDTAVTMPTGYDQKALVGPFAYNSSAGNLKKFRQLNREVFQSPNDTDWRIATGVAGGTRAIYDLAAFLPPRPVMAIFGYRNGTGASSRAFAPLPITNVTANSAIAGQINSVLGTTSATIGGYVSPMAVDYLAAYVHNDVATEEFGVAGFRW